MSQGHAPPRPLPLLTSLFENETVSFSAGLDGTTARSGQMTRIAVEDRSGRRIGGRIRAATGRSITFGADASGEVAHLVTVILPSVQASLAIRLSFFKAVETW